MIGKGLESLIPKKEQGEKKENEPAKDFIFWLEIDKIKPNPFQPRKEFKEEEIDSLAESIKKYGLLQPIIVSKTDKKTDSGMTAEYQIIAGERRWRASKRAGLKQIPAIIKEKTNEEKLELALIENVQRKDLNPIDKAMAFKQLKEEFGLLDKEIAQMVGSSREAVTNTLRLLALPEEIKNAVREEKISEGHARALLGVKDEKEMKVLFEEMLKNNYSVRDVERKAKEKRSPQEMVNKEFLEKKIRDVLYYEKIHLQNKKEGIQLIADFESEEAIKRWLKRIMHRSA